MNHLTKLLLIFTLSLTSVFSFAEQESDSDVSTLNGELVRVGDQNQYRYSHKVFNISTNPVGMIYGSYGLSLSMALDSNVAVKFDANYVDYLEDEMQGVEFIVTAPIYFRKVYDDYYIEPGVSYKAGKVAGTPNSIYGPIVYLGHHWMWDSGLNIAAAFGMGRNFGAKDKNGEEIEKIDKLFGSAYLRFGYAF